MSTIERDTVVDVLRKRAPRAVHLGEICSKIGVHRGRRDEVRAALEGLVGLGLVQEMPGNRFRLARPKETAGRRPLPGRMERARVVTTLRGTLHSNPRGFGFVLADDGLPDVFVPADDIGAALHGDRVEVQARPSPKGRDGQVVAVLERRFGRVTGTLHRSGGDYYIEPDDARLRSPMHLVERPPRELRPGSTIVAEIVHYPQDHLERPRVRALYSLGEAGTAAVEVEKIKLREGVIEEFPTEVREEAEGIPTRVLTAERRDREDLRELDLVTIDPPDAKDHDDALYAERRKGGGYRLVVCIADVSHYVREGSAIDREARQRGVSIYLPDRSIPMLPREISSNIASLVPKKDRLCLGVDIVLSTSGRVESYRYIEGVMRSKARITYEGAARALGLTEEGRRQPEAERHRPMLEILLEIGQKLRRRRLKRGALDFDLPEAKVLLDKMGLEPVDVRRSRKDPGIREAYRLVEEMMLVANETVAADLTERRVPAIYRTHGRPDPRKIELFTELGTSLGFEISVEEAEDPRKLSRFLAEIEDLPQAPVLRYLLLRAMQQAVYSTQHDVGHFGLAARHYLHFTSPIRRYPDLAVHRVVRKVVRGEPIDGATLEPRLRQGALEASRLERRAMVVERQVVDLYRAILMQGRVGDELEATISGATEEGFFSSLDAPFVDVFTPVAALGGDYFELDRLGIRLSGFRSGRSFTLGDRIRLRVEEVHLSRRMTFAVPVDAAGESEEPKEEPRPKRRRGRRSRDGGGEKARPAGDKRKARPGSGRPRRRR